MLKRTAFMLMMLLFFYQKKKNCFFLTRNQREWTVNINSNLISGKKLIIIGRKNRTMFGFCGFIIV